MKKSFLEIKELSSSNEKIDFWKSKGKTFSQTKRKTDTFTFSVSFKNSVGRPEKLIMKSLAFRYNKYRNEFYGYGNEENIRSQLKDFDHNLEILEQK